MPDAPRWSLADTHCVWCGKPLAGDVESERHEGRECEEPCWHFEFCWGADCTMDDDPEELLASLRATVEAKGKVIERARETARRIKVSQDFSDYMVLIKDLLDLLSPSKVVNGEAGNE